MVNGSRNLKVTAKAKSRKRKADPPSTGINFNHMIRSNACANWRTNIGCHYFYMAHKFYKITHTKRYILSFHWGLYTSSEDCKPFHTTWLQVKMKEECKRGT